MTLIHRLPNPEYTWVAAALKVINDYSHLKIFFRTYNGSHFHKVPELLLNHRLIKQYNHTPYTLYRTLDLASYTVKTESVLRLDNRFKSFIPRTKLD